MIWNPAMVGLSFFGAINLVSVGLFWYDKHQAQTRGWRIPEKQLQLSALLGGWMGGMWAMKRFKHKTVKQEFKTPYFICAGINVIGSVVGLYALMKSPRYRKWAFTNVPIKQIQ